MGGSDQKRLFEFLDQLGFPALVLNGLEILHSNEAMVEFARSVEAGPPEEALAFVAAALREALLHEGPASCVLRDRNLGRKRAALVDISSQPLSPAPGSPSVLIVTEKTGGTAIAETGGAQAIALLAAGIAHDVRNPLTYLNLNFEALEQVLTAAPPETRTHLDRMRFGLTELAEMFMSFSALCGPAKTAVHPPLNLRDATASAARLVAYRAKSVAEIELVEIPLELQPCLDRNDLTRVLVNLLLNSLDAIEERGNLPGKIRVTCRQFKDSWAIEVEDNGAGIPAELLDRIFEPFFSSKAGGSGLGLHVVQSIVSRLGGKASALSSAGRTSIRIDLPLISVP